MANQWRGRRGLGAALTVGTVLAAASACTHHETASVASVVSSPSPPSSSSSLLSSSVTPADSTSPVPISPPDQSATSPAISSTAPSSASPTASPTAVVAPTPSATVQPHLGGFTATVATVTAADLGASWHAGCPVGPTQLRALTLSYWGFDGVAQTGTLVVNTTVVPAVTRVFRTLFDERFPIRSILPTSNFDGSDDASMAVDNTSAFNCRYAVAAGPPQWSAHAFGKAIDVNTVENPYVFEGKVLPPQGAPFVTRTPYRPGMAVRGGVLVNAFAASGWQWGGRWSSPDYQHFSADGG